MNKFKRIIEETWFDCLVIIIVAVIGFFVFKEIIPITFVIIIVSFSVILLFSKPYVKIRMIMDGVI